MKRIPLWKIKRELKRVAHQVLMDWPMSLSTYLFGRRYYDLFLSGGKVVQSGQVAPSRRVAIYLVFPGQGLLKSHRRVLDYLNGKGFAPVVVSNLPLEPADRATLLENCWTLIERPNFGYDFGGYRDGVLHIADRFPEMDQLVLLNDSAWFPLPGAGDWLAQVEELGTDFVGAASNYGITRPQQREFRNIQWTYSSTHRNFHYCSFAISMSARIFRSRGFKEFWLKFPLTNAKTRTVRRGEIGLSKWVISHGFSHGSTLDIESLDAELRALPDARLNEVFENLIIPEDRRLMDIKSELRAAGTATARKELEKFVLTAVARQGVSYALADYTIRDKGFPFLKKSPVWLSEEASNITRDIARHLDGAIGEEIRAEIEDLRAAKAPGFSGGDTQARPVTTT